MGTACSKETLLAVVDRDGEGCDVVQEVLTDQLQRQMSDGLISAPQLLSELLHLLQESLNLNTHTHTQALMLTPALQSNWCRVFVLTAHL